MIHRPVRTDCNQPWLEVEANLLAHRKRKRGFDKPRTWGFIFRINAFPGFTWISPSNHRESIYSSGCQRYPLSMLPSEFCQGRTLIRPIRSSYHEHDSPTTGPICPEVEISAMWRTLPGTPIGLFGIACMVAVCVGLGAGVLQ